MKLSQDHFNRLFKAAASAPIEALGPPPPALETRVLAYWRAERSALAIEMFALRRIFRVALSCAYAVMLVAVAVSMLELSSTPVDEWAVPDTAVYLALTR